MKMSISHFKNDFAAYKISWEFLGPNDCTNNGDKPDFQEEKFNRQSSRPKCPSEWLLSFHQPGFIKTKRNCISTNYRVGITVCFFY